MVLDNVDFVSRMNITFLKEVNRGVLQPARNNIMEMKLLKYANNATK